MGAELSPESTAPDHAELARSLAEAFSSRGGAVVALREALEGSRPEDVAAAISSLEPPQRLAVYYALPEDDREVVIEEADPAIKADLLTRLKTEDLVSLVDEMAPDDAADVVLELPGSLQETVLKEVEKTDPEQAEDIRELIEYDPDSAGGIMTTEFIRVTENATAGRALQTIQGAANAETISTLFVTNLEDKLIGIISIRELLAHGADELISAFMERDLITARVEDDRAQAASLLARYNLQVLPIVDEHGIIRGIITVDDVIDALQEEFDEDLFRLAGTSTPEYVQESVGAKGKKRLPWLLITLAFGMGLAFLLGQWEELIARNTKLAFFIPVLAAMAGSASIQASTLVVRALSHGELQPQDLGRLILIEGRVGLLTGSVCGTLVFATASLFAGSARFGLVVGIGMIGGMISATTMGTVIPLVCSRFDVDPALSAGPFITALNDVTSLAIFLSVANALLP